MCGLTLNELDEKRVLSVTNHKTAAKGPARLTIDDDSMQRLVQYVQHVRPQIGRMNKLTNVLLVAGPSPIRKMSTLTRHLSSKYSMEVPTSTKVRKAVAKRCDDTDAYPRLCPIVWKHTSGTMRVWEQTKVHKIVKNMTVTLKVMTSRKN